MLKIENGKITINNHTILDNINLEIYPELLTVIIGPNGAGKTTLINVLGNTKKLTKGNLVTSFKKSILIPQRTYYPEGITLYEYVSSVFFQTGWKWSLKTQEKNMVCEILEKLNLISKKDLVLNTLSAGELQLANVALCLVSEADFILLDEPSANLDLLNQVIILDILKKLTKKKYDHCSNYA
ncbi:MAG: ABC transporter ATP-binding protein [bacterium]